MDLFVINGKSEELFSALRLLGAKTPWRHPGIATLFREAVLKHFLREQTLFD